MDDSVTLHIGLHKTGTTSIQHFLHAHRLKLSGCGIACYAGAHMPENHVELHTAALQKDRLTPFKIMSGVIADHAYFEAVRARVREFLSASTGMRPVFSAEGLSYIRHPEEIDRLSHILSGRPIRIIVYLREPERFRASYAAALRRQRNAPTDDPESFAYVAEDSWLFDYEKRLRVFEESLGPQNVTKVGYDEAVAKDGSVIPSFIAALGCGEHFAPAEWETYWLNANTELTTPENRSRVRSSRNRGAQGA